MTTPRDVVLSDPALLATLAELAVACEQQVLTAVGVPLEGEVETLPLLDHYVRLSRQALCERPELLPLLQRTVGAYFGKVAVEYFGGSWLLVSQDVHGWFVGLSGVYLAFNPVAMAHAALTWALPKELSELGPADTLIVARDERGRVEQRLDALPALKEEDFYSLSTRLETLEIVVGILRDARVVAGDDTTVFEADDYREDLVRTAFSA